MLHVHQSRNKQVPLWSKLKGQTGHQICPLHVSLQVITFIYCTFFSYFKCTYYWYGTSYVEKGGGAYTRYLFIYFLYNRNIILLSFAFHCSVWQSQLIFGKFKTKMESLLVLTRLEMLDILQHRYTCSVISP